MTLRLLALSLVLILIALAALTTYRAHKREAAAEASYPPAGQIVQVGGYDVHVVVDGQGPDLVLIHGLSGSARDYTFELVGHLTDRYRVFVVDRPGMGWSDPHPNGGDLTVQVDLIRQATAQLGAQRPLVLGQSYGGAVALNWAVTAPDSLSGLVLLSSPSHPWPDDLSTYYKVISHPVGQALVVPLITAFVPQDYVQSEIEGVFAPQSAPAGYAQHFGPGMTLRRSALRANAEQRRDLKPQIIDMVPAYASLSMPIEALHGTADSTVPLEIHSARLAAYDTVNLTELDGIGHMPQHVAIPQVLAAIDRAAARARLHD